MVTGKQPNTELQKAIRSHFHRQETKATASTQHNSCRAKAIKIRGVSVCNI